MHEVEDESARFRDQMQALEKDLERERAKVNRRPRLDPVLFSLRCSSCHAVLCFVIGQVTGLVAQLRNAEKHSSLPPSGAGSSANPKGLAAEVVALRSRMTTLEKEVIRAKERTAKADEALVKAQEALEEASDDRARMKVQLATLDADLNQALQR